MPDADLTELVDIDPSRVDLVKSPANGFPVLLMKAIQAADANETQEDQDAVEDTTQKDAEDVTEVTETEKDIKTPEATEPQADEPVEKSVDELVQEAVAKAMEAHQEAIKGLEGELAALKETPIPGGPVITVPQSQRTAAEKASALGEAGRFERLAKSTGDRELAGFYERKAREARKAANA